MVQKLKQLTLPFTTSECDLVPNPKDRNLNRLHNDDKAFHDWYRFVLSFPPHLVRQYIDDFKLDSGATILDPFCGTGTTVVEAKLNGLVGIGIEANPIAHFAGCTKLKWSIDPEGLREYASCIADKANAVLGESGIDDSVEFRGDLSDLMLLSLDSDAEKLLIKNSISPLPLHKSLVLLELLSQYSRFVLL